MIINYKDLKNIRKKHNNIVICAGCFDLFHSGHLAFFEESKKNGDILVVAVLGDKFVKSKKGDKRPIINENDRIKLIDGLKIVDYVLLVNRTFTIRKVEESERFLWEKYMPIFDLLKPNVLCYFSDIKISENTKKEFNKNNIKLVPINLLNDLSTTKIIERIKNNNM